MPKFTVVCSFSSEGAVPIMWTSIGSGISFLNLTRTALESSDLEVTADDAEVPSTCEIVSSTSWFAVEVVWGAGLAVSINSLVFAVGPDREPCSASSASSVQQH